MSVRPDNAHGGNMSGGQSQTDLWHGRTAASHKLPSSRRDGAPTETLSDDEEESEPVAPDCPTKPQNGRLEP